MVLLVLVALDDLGVVDLFPVDRAHPLVADPAAVRLVELVEPEALRLGGRIHPDGDGDQPEGDRPLPDRLARARPPYDVGTLRERRARRKVDGHGPGTTVRWPSNATIGGLAPALGSGKRRHLPFPQPLPARRSGDAWRLEADGRELRLSNLHKVYWPAEGITKGDLLAYYWNVADLLLPHLRDRPLTMKRMPDGLAGSPSTRSTSRPTPPTGCPPAAVPDRGGLPGRRVRARPGPGQPAVRGQPRLHRDAPPALAGRLPRPARLRLLRPRPVRAVHLRGRPHRGQAGQGGAGRLGLRGYAKTSGATGMQVFVPLDGTHTHDRRPGVRRAGGAAGRPRLPGEGRPWPGRWPNGRARSSSTTT